MRNNHDKDGREIMDPTPMQPPLGYKRAPTLAEQIRLQVLAHKLELLDAMEETEEEADDFEVGEDWEPMSKHENDGVPTLKELKARAEAINEEIRNATMRAAREQFQKELDAKSQKPVELKYPVEKQPS